MQTSEAKYCLDMHSAIGVTCLRNSPFPHLWFKRASVWHWHWHTLALFLPSCTPLKAALPQATRAASEQGSLACSRTTQNVGSTKPSQAEQVD